MQGDDQNIVKKKEKHYHLAAGPSAIADTVRDDDSHSGQTEQRQDDDAKEKSGAQPKMDFIVGRQCWLNCLRMIVNSEVIKFPRFFHCVVEIPVSSQEIQDARPHHSQGRDQVSVAA